MAPVLEGLSVLDLSWGVAGPIATMLLADAGADVVKVEPPGGDPFRSTPGYAVWNRGKRSIVLDLATAGGRGTLEALARRADVLVESFAPGTMARLGLDHDRLAAANPRLITCSITGYGRHGAVASRPGWDALVQARSGLMGEQPGLRPGPVFLHLQLPSYGAALAAAVGIQAALCAREVTGRGQWVETSLMQGALLWTTQIWKRAERPTPPLGDLWKFKELGPTPCFEGSDGRWFHPMPQGIPVALAHLGRDPGGLSGAGIASGDLAVRTHYFATAREIYLQRPAQEWVDLLQANDVPCQMIQPGEDALDHPQVVHNGAALDVDLPGVGTVRQVGRTYTLERHEAATPTPPPAVGQHTEEVLAAAGPPAPASTSTSARARATLRHPLDGVRVLDFGTAIAGPFSGMILGDLGADVIKVDGLLPSVGTPGDAVWAAGARGKRSICIDLKHPEGQAIAAKLIATADVLHYNLRTGVAERLGYGYEQAKAINPGIVFCHLTGYGNTGPLARWPGVDQMAQALCGLEHEQGATDDGGHPTWLRFGMVDAVTGLLSVLGVLQGLYSRHRSGEGQAVAADILSAGMLLCSDAFRGPDSLPTRAHLDRDQTGLSPLYRLYEAADGWLCLAAPRPQDWAPLCAALPDAGLGADPRFATPEGRAEHAGVLAAVLEATFAGGKVGDWWAHLDAHGVACEIATETAGQDWWDDPDAIANEWVASYPHPVWGRLEQPGRFFDFSATPGRLGGAPPLIGGHTREVLLELGYREAEADDLKARGVVAW